MWMLKICEEPAEQKKKNKKEVETTNKHIYLEITNSPSSSVQSITKDSYYIVKIAVNGEGNSQGVYGFFFNVFWE